MSSQYSHLDPLKQSLFRRCVSCPQDPPACPACAADETCSLTAASCDSCPTTTCVRIGSLPGQTAPEKKTPVGAIVGGVIGGIALIAGIYLIWRFCIRKKPNVETWDPPEKRDQSTLHRSARQSTAHSIASTVLTRASNVIQIAYIPGVTVRSPPESPGLVPPVPSIPGNNSTSGTPQMEQHFFMPRDLRDSTWSDTSSIDPRISIAPSLYRDSVATTIYRNDAIVPPIPAQHAFRGQANVVSVKSGGTTPSNGGTPSSRTPPMPQSHKFINTNSSIVARNVTARPIEVKKINSGVKIPTMANLAKRASLNADKSTAKSPANPTPVYSDEKEVLVNSTATTPSTVFEQSPISPVTIPRPVFAQHAAHSSGVSSVSPSSNVSDSSTGGPTHRHSNSKNAALNAMIEDAINRARDPQLVAVPSTATRPDLVKHDDSGPFSDANEVKENLN